MIDGYYMCIIICAAVRLDKKGQHHNIVLSILIFHLKSTYQYYVSTDLHQSFREAAYHHAGVFLVNGLLAL